MTAGYSMLAMFLSCLPQRWQMSISMTNTRFNRRAGITAALSLLCGPNTR